MGANVVRGSKACCHSLGNDLSNIKEQLILLVICPHSLLFHSCVYNLVNKSTHQVLREACHDKGRDRIQLVFSRHKDKNR